MKEEMERLISLQRIDSEIARLDHEIARCEESVIRREQAIQEKRNRLEALRARGERLADKQKANQTEHDDALTRMKDAQGKMMLVQTPREHQALLKGIEDNKKVVKDSEERALQFIEQIEQLEAEAAELEARCEAETAELERARQEAAEETQKLAAEKTKVEGERTEKAAAVDAGSMRRYERLIEKRAGLAVTALLYNTKRLSGVCQGCHMTLPPQQVNEVRKGDKLNCCPTCQRILFYLEDNEEEKEAAAAEAEEAADQDDERDPDEAHDAE